MLKKNICKRSCQVFLLLLFYCISFINFSYAKRADNLSQNNKIRKNIIPEKFNRTPSHFTSNKNCETLPSQTQYIKLGSRGHDVYCIQKQLKKWVLRGWGEFGSELNNSKIQAITELHYSLTNQVSNLQVDGIFGTQTKKAIISFQKYHGLEADGVVGSQTSQILWISPVSALIRLMKHQDANLRILGSFGVNKMGTRIKNSLGVDVYGLDFLFPVGAGDIQNPDVKAAIPILVKLLNDKHTNVRLSASNTLRWINSKSVPALATPTLIKLLEDKNSKVRLSAIITLNFLLPDTNNIAIEAVIKLLEDKDANIHLYTLRFIEDIFRYKNVRTNLKSQTVVESLIKFVENKDNQGKRILKCI